MSIKKNFKSSFSAEETVTTKGLFVLNKIRKMENKKLNNFSIFLSHVTIASIKQKNTKISQQILLG
jgi:hypothetical protein